MALCISDSELNKIQLDIRSQASRYNPMYLYKYICSNVYMYVCACVRVCVCVVSTLLTANAMKCNKSNKNWEKKQFLDDFVALGSAKLKDT